ncbi:MAG: DUF6531 domain-containing protein, partial [Actinobacteria bacterium]|nr:DUF6531 domain-containing protein [Actinomycetota bacterium]
ACGEQAHAENPTRCWAGSVNTGTGNLFTSTIDAALPGIGIPFTFSRSYNAQDTWAPAGQSPMGPGWTFSYNVGLDLTGLGGDVTVRTEDGQQEHFANLGSAYAPDPGVHDTLVKNPDGTYTLTRRDQIKYVFNSSGQLTSVKDPNNQGLTLDQSSGRLGSVTDSVGRQITITYNGNGLISTLSLPDGRSVGYAYTNGRLTAVTDIRGDTIGYGYDAAGRLNGITDQNGHTTTVVFGSDARVSTLTDARGHATTFSWNPATQRSTITDNRSKAWTDAYSSGTLVSATDPLGGVTKWTYDTALNRTSVTDAGNNNAAFTTVFKYDGSGNLTEEDDPAPLGYVKQWAYNDKNEVKTFIDGRGKTTRFEYDASGNLICVLLANADATTCSPASPQYKITLAYDARGLLTSKTDPNQHTWTYGYDGSGNLNSITAPPTDAAPDGAETTLTWNAKGELAAMIDPRGNLPGANPDEFTWRYTYNDADQLTSVEDPLGDMTIYGYDFVGNLTGTTDARGNVTSYKYDENNNLACVLYPDSAAASCAVAPASSKATYGYDNSNNMTTRTDGNGHTWTYHYDDGNRLDTTTSPKSTIWTRSYYPDGLLKKRTLPSGNVTYTYDQLSRLTGVAYSGVLTPSVTYGYDGANNRTSMTDGGGTVSYTYDDLDRLTALTRGSDTFGYHYKDGGQIGEVTYPDATVVDYAYNADDTLESVTSGGATTSYKYNAAGRLNEKDLPNGNVVSMPHDDAERLIGVSNAREGVVLSHFDMTLDGVGDPAQIVTSSGTENYTYDAFNRITDACYPTCGDAGTTGVRYSYDPAGNLSQKKQLDGTTTTTTTYAYDADDELCWANQGDYQSNCSLFDHNYTYDDNGNITADPLRTMSWDLENRALSVTFGDHTDVYTYDGDGNRLTRVHGTDTTTYAWDESGALPELALERDGSGNLLRRYINGAGPISMREGGADYYYLTDPQGSVVNVTTADGTSKASYSYDSFGNARVNSIDPDAPTNLLRYQGQLMDEASLLYDFRARMYDPGTARFLSQDPMPQGFGQPAVASYVYALNRPLVLSDLSGMTPEVNAGGGLPPPGEGFGGLGGAAVAEGAEEAAAAAEAEAATNPRFIANSAGEILDTSRVTIPEGKFGYLLESPSKADVFADSMGFDKASLDSALRSHLVENFGSASPSVQMLNGEGLQIGTKFSVIGQLTGQSGATWEITSVWGIDWDGTIRLITATP